MYICNVFIKFNKAAVFEGHKTPQGSTTTHSHSHAAQFFREKFFIFYGFWAKAPHSFSAFCTLGSCSSKFWNSSGLLTRIFWKVIYWVADCTKFSLISRWRLNFSLVFLKVSGAFGLSQFPALEYLLAELLPLYGTLFGRRKGLWTKISTKFPSCRSSLEKRKIGLTLKMLIIR